MTRRAVIYIRTSSEIQAEKSSPVEQEVDCRRLAEEKGLDVVYVYRDTEKYRVGNKLVEPSGNRSDRPGLVAMLKVPPKMNLISSSPGGKTGYTVDCAPC